MFLNSFIVTLAIILSASALAWGDGQAIPVFRHVESVVPLEKQPQESDPATIWYDDFNGPERPYGERQGELDARESLGGRGKSLLCFYPKGGQGIGNRKLFFGDCPDHRNVVRRGETFDEIYWRIYVKHQPHWTGGGEAKLTRATSLVSDRWTQAMISHVWSGNGTSLTLDPASGVRGGRIVTTRYNDFANLRWLGSKPDSAFAFSSPEEAGWWVCVEAYAKLNAPGKKDAVNRLWIDGRLECERTGFDWRGTYAHHGINAIFLEAYWNQGSPVEQNRWIDNFVVSSRPIGPVVCPVNPVLLITPDSNLANPTVWQVELKGLHETQAAWRSRPSARSQGTVQSGAGEFLGELLGREHLKPATIYHCRLRQMGPDSTWSDWGPWHQSFSTGE